MENTKTLGNAVLTINVTLAVLWIYQGLIPKVIFKAIEEQKFWQYFDINEINMLFLIPLSGYVEIMYGVLFLIFRQSKFLHYLNIFGLIGLALTVAIIYPSYFLAGFNPFVINVAMAMLSVVAIQLLNIKNTQ